MTLFEVWLTVGSVFGVQPNAAERLIARNDSARRIPARSLHYRRDERRGARRLANVDSALRDENARLCRMRDGGPGERSGSLHHRAMSHSTVSQGTTLREFTPKARLTNGIARRLCESSAATDRASNRPRRRATDLQELPATCRGMVESLPAAWPGYDATRFSSFCHRAFGYAVEGPFCCASFRA